MRQAIKGTISIVSHGHGSMIKQLLQDLARQKGIEDWLVILTLNIPENIEDVDLSDLHVIRVENTHPKGFGANHNAAANNAEGNLFLIVNPDIRLVAPDTLRQIAAMEWNDQRPALRAPVVIAPDGAREDSVRRNLSLPNLLFRSLQQKNGWEANPEKREFFWLAGMFLIVPIGTFRALKGFDEGFRLYCEDYDLSARWHLAGGRVEVIQSLEVVHDAQRDSRRSLRHMRWHVASLLRVWLSVPFWRVVFTRYR